MEIVLLIGFIIFCTLGGGIQAAEAARENPQREFAFGAITGAVVGGGIGAVALFVWSWLTQNDLSWLLAVVGFLCIAIFLVSALLGGILRLLYRD